MVVDWVEMGGERVTDGRLDEGENGWKWGRSVVLSFS
jgi:hypothetical protein